MPSSDLSISQIMTDAANARNQRIHEDYELQLYDHDFPALETFLGWIEKLEALQTLYKHAKGRSSRERTDAKHFFMLINLLHSALFCLFPMVVNVRKEAILCLDRCTTLSSCQHNLRCLDVRLLNARSQAYGVFREFKYATHFSRDIDSALRVTHVAGGQLMDGFLTSIMPNYGYDALSRTYYYSPAVSRSRFPPASKPGRHLFTVVPDLLCHTLVFRLRHAGPGRLDALLRAILFVPSSRPPAATNEALEKNKVRRDQKTIGYYEEQCSYPLAHRDVPFPYPPRPGTRPAGSSVYARMGPCTEQEVQGMDDVMTRLRVQTLDEIARQRAMGQRR
ncbi:hypothetical protein RB595_006107 [Gaeumannomyces hyphopodioides]